MVQTRKINALVHSCRLLDEKINKAKYWTLNGSLHPDIKRQILSIIKQAKNIDTDNI